MQGLLTNNETKQAFVDGNLVIDCRDIRLIQNTPDSPIEFRGSGFLKIDPRSAIEARFISTGGVPASYTPFDKLLRMQKIKSGQVYPESHYFSLIATDVNGHEWTNSSVDVDYTYYEAGAVIVLKCGWVRSIVPAKGEKDSVHMLFMDELPFPLNLMEQNKITREGRESVSLNFKLSRGTAGGANFTYGKPEDSSKCFELYAKPEDGERLPFNFEYRIVEAIRFLSATSLSYAICESIHNEIKIIEISPTPLLNTGFFPQPLGERRDWSEDFYRLLDRYLAYTISNANGEEFSFISKTMGGLYQLKGVSLDSIALLVGVAVESIVQHEFGQLGKAEASTLADLKTIFSSLDGLAIQPATLTRAKSSLGGMKNSRAVDKLFAIQKAGVIKEGEIKGWKSLRDSTAHGGLHIPPEEIQRLLDGVYKSSVLLNKLVFHSIGYCGRYIDYSTPGWPEAHFGLANSVICSNEQKNTASSVVSPPGLFHRIKLWLLQKIYRCDVRIIRE